jgi:chromosome segregation ATPase
MSALQHAANVVESRARTAPEHIERLSRQLEAAKGRIRELEAEVRYHQERVDRAEEWLHRIYIEIEARFPRRGS